MADRHVNVVVVGAGAGGGVVAKELSQAGLSVLLLERGGWARFDDLDHDELSSQSYGVLRNAFGPDEEHHPRVAVSREGRSRVVTPCQGAYGHVAACVGSGTASYGAMAWRFMPQDFRMRSEYGPLEGSTLDDWPVSYEDLEPHYAKAEWEIGVSGDDSGNPFAPPRQKTVPHAPARFQQSRGDAGTRGEGARLSPVSHPHAAQHDPVRRQARMHPVPLLQRIRLRGECQRGDAQHGDPGGAGHGQLRTADQLHRLKHQFRREGEGPLRRVL